MSKTGCIVLAVVSVLVIGAILAGSQYNGLVKAQESVNTAWAGVQSAYQRRLDLIPNLVETVKGVAKFEKDTYTAVAEARARAGQTTINAEALDNPETLRNFEQAQTALSASLARLLAVAEAYPQLKANENFLQLQSQLEGTENRIAVERRRFNEAAQAYNTRVRSFPANLVAGLFGFHPRAYFQANPEAQTAPKVQF